MKICIVGAGVAGLASAKNCKSQNFRCVVYEQTGNVGGIWNYSESVGTDPEGIPVHSVMYEKLKTNLPKDTMEFLDHSYPESLRESFLTQPQVLTYILSYVERFKLREMVQFFHQVLEVRPLQNQKWVVKVKNLKTRVVDEEEFDAVMVCNGHYSSPMWPEIRGRERFKGAISHSGHFRKAEPFRGRKVLVVGFGPSGCGIAEIVQEAAQKVVISGANKGPFFRMTSEISTKPEIAELTENGVMFKDGSVEDFDDIIYCTGYRYSLPFLSPDCAIKVDENNNVKCLYKQMINVEHPTMAFIGISFISFVFQMVDFQSQFFLKSLAEDILPPKSEMLEDLQRDIEAREAENWPKKHLHKLDHFMREYYGSLAEIGKLKPIPNVFFKIYETVKERKRFDDVYKRLDDENFVILNEN